MHFCLPQFLALLFSNVLYQDSCSPLVSIPLIAEALHMQKMRVDSRKSQEMAWMKLLSSVQQLNVAKGVRPKLILQLLDLMYANGAQVNAFHICRAISVRPLSCDSAHVLLSPVEHWLFPNWTVYHDHWCSWPLQKKFPFSFCWEALRGHACEWVRLILIDQPLNEIFIGNLKILCALSHIKKNPHFSAKMCTVIEEKHLQFTSQFTLLAFEANLRVMIYLSSQMCFLQNHLSFEVGYLIS